MTESLPDWPPFHRAGVHTSRVVEMVVRDRIELALFLGILLFHAVTWRTGPLINDSYTLANGLVAVSEGHLDVARIVYGPESGVTPGMSVVDGELYARNYGQLVLALPFLWLLEGVTAVADLRVAIAAAWSLCLLLAAVQLGHVLGRPRPAGLIGSLLALGLFGSNLGLAGPLTVPGLHLLALQLQTMVAVALTGVVVHRLVGTVTSTRVGIAAGVAVALASPLGFWATYPKRHALVALLVACVAYWLVRTRQSEQVHYRALAYGAVGLVAWVHAGEALVLLVGVAAVDLATARRTDPRTVAVLAAALAVSLVPMLLTNALISGDPLRPPRLLSPFYGNRTPNAITLVGATLTTTGTVPAFAVDLGPVGRLVENLLRGLRVAVTEPERLYHVFVRSGYIPQVAAEDGGEAISLSLLESMPLVGALFGVPLALVRLVRSGDERSVAGIGAETRARLQRPARTCDALSVVLPVLFVLLYVQRLPLEATITVRYLVPIVPLLAYAVARLPAVRRAVEADPRGLGWGYVGSTLIGGQLLLLVVLASALTLGEAVQLHALAALGTATLLAVWMVGTEANGWDTPRLGTVCLGLAAAATTAFVLLSGVVYFSYAGEHVLPLAGWFSELLPL